MKFKKWGRSRRPRAFFSIALPIILFALALWVCVMGLITETAAMELAKQVEYKAQKYANYYATRSSRLFGFPADTPGVADINRICQVTQRFQSAYFQLDPSFPLWARPPRGQAYTPSDYYMDVDFAIIYKDSEGNILQQSGLYLYFPYMSAESWESGSEDYEGVSYVDMTGLGYGNLFTFRFVQPARLTGYFEGAEFIPTRIDIFDSYTKIEPNNRKYLVWETMTDRPAQTERETVTIYTEKLSTTDYYPSDPITVDGSSYANLLAWLQNDPYNHCRTTTADTLAVAWSSYVDAEGKSVTAHVGLHAQPLPFVIEKLTPFYICSFLIVAVAVLLILLSIRRNLIKPVKEMAYWSTGKLSPLPMGGKSKWHEPRLLQENYATAQQAANDAQNEITRLHTALEYSQNAELHRRQMISNITHELKTPLAVIHSYAEGLRDGIAADKQSQYLNVILEEAQRMDAMVLEMLDLSRLEAGKVRLASDSFSLLKLTRSIFGKLEPLATEKGLVIEYGLTEEFDITADESRIGQVITNFATNAIKYTPEGGKIHINVFRHGGKTLFSIENQCSPLSEEALNRVWDSFYRTEQSRTTKGTGLGLTIARTIIELHGGACTATNTSDGVEFRFMLP